MMQFKKPIRGWSWLAAASIGLAIAAGCSSGAGSLAGTWKTSDSKTPITLTIHDDGTFNMVSSQAKVNGNCDVSGNKVKLYVNVNSGGSPGFGSHWDGSYDFDLSADRKSMTAANAAQAGLPQITLTEQSPITKSADSAKPGK